MTRRICLVGCLACAFFATPARLSADNSCFSTYAAGLGALRIVVCVSAHGNLVHFEAPSGVVQVIGGEGYALCLDGAMPSYDAGDVELGFGPATIVQPNGPNTFPLTIIRDTVDGSLRLEQTLSPRLDRGHFQVFMRVANIGATTRTGVKLARYAHLSGGDSALNRFQVTHDSAGGSGERPSGVFGLLLTALSFDVPHTAAAEPVDAWALSREGCAAAGTVAPEEQADGVVWITYNIGTLKPRGGKRVKASYWRY